MNVAVSIVTNVWRRHICPFPMFNFGERRHLIERYTKCSMTLYIIIPLYDNRVKCVPRPMYRSVYIVRLSTL